MADHPAGLDPCHCEKRRTRVVFPSGNARFAWSLIFSLIGAWGAWVSHVLWYELRPAVIGLSCPIKQDAGRAPSSERERVSE